jgi:hypothetical protein
VVSEGERVPTAGMSTRSARHTWEDQLVALTQASLSPPLPPPNTTTFFRHPTSSRSLNPSFGPPSATVLSVDAVRLPLVDDGSYEAITKACAFLAWDRGRPLEGRISGRAYNVRGARKVPGLDLSVRTCEHCELAGLAQHANLLDGTLGKIVRFEEFQSR